jgi:general secretion pathway protein G
MDTKEQPPRQNERKAGKSSGFTLIEMLIVLALIGLVATLAISNLGGLFGQAKEETAENWVNGTGKSLMVAYFARVGTYPKSIDELMTPTDGKAAFVERAKDIQNPWGKPYQYKQPGGHNPNSFDLWAITPEGKEIGNWDK